MTKVATKKPTTKATKDIKEVVTVQEDSKAKVVSKNIGHQVEVDGVTYASKTSAILALSAVHSRAVVAKKLGIRYQFVNNVLLNQANKAV